MSTKTPSQEERGVWQIYKPLLAKPHPLLSLMEWLISSHLRLALPVVTVNVCRWVPLAYRMKSKPSNGLRLCVFQHLLHTQCPEVHIQTRRVRGYVSHMVTAPRQQFSASIIWTPSVILQLSECFSYLNTLRSQHPNGPSIPMVPVSQRIQSDFLLLLWIPLKAKSLKLLVGLQ